MSGAPRLQGLIVFDLDGTLIDSRIDLANSANEMLATYGASALAIDEVAAMVGDGAKVLVERALAASGLDPSEPDALSRFQAIYDRRLLDTTVPYDGIVGVVAAATSRAQLAVLTNKPEAPSRRILERFDLAHYFGWVIGGDAAFPRKPDPGGLEFLISESKTRLDKVLMVGDSRIDVDTARRAKVRVCFARYGFGWLRGEVGIDEADFVAERPQEITGVIERFLRHHVC